MTLYLLLKIIEVKLKLYKATRYVYMSSYYYTVERKGRLTNGYQFRSLTNPVWEEGNYGSTCRRRY